MKIKVIFIIVIGFIGVMNGAYGAKTIFVPADYLTIQEAIDAAHQGDTIRVAPGEYRNVTMKKNIRLVGEDRESTIIKSISVSHGPSVFFNDHDNASLENFTIIGGGSFNLYDGGAIALKNSENVVVKNCTIKKINSPNASFAAIALFSSNCTVDSCTLENNAGIYSGTVYCDSYSTLRIHKSIIRNNILSEGNNMQSGILYIDRANLELIDCVFENNQTKVRNTSNIIFFLSDKSLTIKNCRFTGNIGSGTSRCSAIRVGYTSYSYHPNVNISNCIFENNDSDITIYTAANPVQISNCSFIDTTPDSNMKVGAIYPDSIFSNCLFDGSGLGINSNVQNATITNCTFVNATQGFKADTNKPQYILSNCIFWDNGIDLGTTTGLTVTNSCIEDGYPGNISADPLFVDVANHDFHLTFNSPCRNTGNNGAVGIGTKDLEGKERILDGTVDMGCYEYPEDLPAAAITSIDTEFEYNQKPVVKAVINLFDDDSSPANLLVEYSTDSATTWYPATGDFSSSAPFATSPLGESLKFYWDAVADLGRGSFTGIIVRVTPSEEITSGYPVISDPFSLNTFGEIIFDRSSFVYNTADMQFILPSATQTLNLRSAQADSLAWSISNAPMWLSITPSSGTVGKEGTLVNLTVLPKIITPGTYTAEIILNSTDAFNTPQILTVRLNIGVERIVTPGGMTIQQTINTSNQGDIVLVMNGRYNETITMKPDVSLIGEDEKNTIIIGNGELPVITAKDIKNVVLRHLTLKRGTFGLDCTHCYIDIANVTACENFDGGFAFYRYSGCSLRDSSAFNNASTGLDCNTLSRINAVNCLFANNGYAGVQAVNSPTSIMNCTIANNAEYGILSRLADVSITNSIIYGNGDDLDGCSAKYSLIGDGDAGAGNITGDPLFVSPDYMDYHISDGSPCIDAGTPDGAPAADFEGDARTGNPDIGYDEFTGNIQNMIATSNTIYVDASAAPGGDGTVEHPFQKIQDGVDAANYGDTVIVLSGAYSEEVVMKQNITLKGSEPLLPALTAPNKWSDGIVSMGLTQGIIENFKFSGFYDALVSIGASVEMRNCEAQNAKLSCLAGLYSSMLEIRNMLFTGTKVSGIDLWMTSDVSASNCTIVGQNLLSVTDYGIYSYRSEPTISDSILWGSSAELVDCAAIYSDIEGGATGIGNISADPLFISGPLGDYYLSQVFAGNPATSPCVDTGSDTAVNLGLDSLTTRTDGMTDEGIADMGYHYPYLLMIISISIEGDDAVIKWSARPTKTYVVQWSDDMTNWNDVPVGAVNQWYDVGYGSVVNRFYRVIEE